MAGRTILILVYGGRSAEHEISCISASHIARSADTERFEILPVGITHDARWVDARRLVGALDPQAQALPSPDLAEPGDFLERPGFRAALAAAGFEDGAEAVVFPIVHGQMGEDGTLQGMAEIEGIPYVGAGVLGSALCMDKSLAKEVLDRRGLPQTPWMGVAGRDLEGAPETIEERFAYPVYVKPANLGSSIGISRAGNRDELVEALTLAAQYDDHLVVEAEVRGREIEVAVMGNDELFVSMPGEIDTGGEYYDFEEKYIVGSAKLLVPAPLTEGQIEEIRALAIDVYRALRCEGFARVDFFLSEDGRFLANEVNTLPGFTPISMYPMLCAATGIGPTELVNRLIDLGVERFDRRASRRVDRN